MSLPLLNNQRHRKTEILSAHTTNVSTQTTMASEQNIQQNNNNRNTSNQMSHTHAARQKINAKLE